jgi:hypothetical protein
MTLRKLTDTQLVLLSAAAQRDDGAIDPPEGPKGGLAKKAISKLLTDGLLEEAPAGGMLPVWRRNNDRGPLALRIPARGLVAIEVEKNCALPEAPPLSGKTAEDGEPTPDAPSQKDECRSQGSPEPTCGRRPQAEQPRDIRRTTSRNIASVNTLEKRREAVAERMRWDIARRLNRELRMLTAAPHLRPTTSPATETFPVGQRAARSIPERWPADGWLV